MNKKSEHKKGEGILNTTKYMSHAMHNKTF